MMQLQDLKDFDARNTSSYEGGKVPDNTLRQIFHKYELKEELAKELANRGFTSIGKMAALGADETVVEHKLRGRPGGSGIAPITAILADSVWGDGSEKETEIVSVTAVYVECKMRHKKLAALETVADFNSEAPPIQIPPEEKLHAIEAFNKKYPDLQLTNETCPHFDIWDELASQFTRGSFKYPPIGTIRTRSEELGKKSKYQLDLDVNEKDLGQLVFKPEGHSVQAAKIESVADCMFRFKILWVLLHLIGQYTVRGGMKIYARWERWVRQDRPKLITWVNAYQICFKEIIEKMTFEKSAFDTFIKAVEFVSDDSMGRLQTTFNRALVLTGSQSAYDPLATHHTPRDHASDFAFEDSAKEVQGHRARQGAVIKDKKMSKGARSRLAKQAKIQNSKDQISHLNKKLNEKKFDDDEDPRPLQRERSRSGRKLRKGPGKGNKGPAGDKTGKGKSAGKGLSRLDPTEVSKLRELRQTDQQGDQICLAYNSSAGCKISNCKFRHMCMKCSSKAHGAAQNHRL